jgi:hypothetical protein
MTLGHVYRCGEIFMEDVVLAPLDGIATPIIVLPLASMTLQCSWNWIAFGVIRQSPEGPPSVY